MDIVSAVKAINKLLRTIQPHTFCSFWIRLHAPHVYRFIQKNVSAEVSGIDWDRITRALNRRLQLRWQASHRGRRSEGVRGKMAAGIILRKHHDKLYTFLSPADADDEQARDIISIALVKNRSTRQCSCQTGNHQAGQAHDW